jgi:RNA polymerase sigma-70 factor (ECF subfamily)
VTDGRRSGDDGYTVSYDLGDRAAPPGMGTDADEAAVSDLGAASGSSSAWPASASSDRAASGSSSTWPASASSSGWRRARPRHVPPHRRAFHRFYREHFGLVWSMVRRFGVPSAQHEDAVQEVWLVAYRRLHTLEPEASAKAWLSTITRRVASRLRRTEHRQHRKHAALHVASERARGPSPSRVDEQDARCLVDALLAVLDDEQRDVLVLAQVHGLSGPEIAQTLAIPLNTAYSRLRLAKRRVDRFVAEVGTEQATVIRELRRSEEPPPRAASRAWVVLVPQLRGVEAVAGTAAGGGVMGGLAGMKTFAIVVAVGVVGLVTARAVVDARAATGGERVVSTDVEAAHGDAQAPALGEPALPEPQRARVEMTSASPRLGASVAVPNQASASLGPSEPARRAPKSGRTPSSDDDAVSRLAAEAELLARAQRALREGDAAGALRLLEEHERRFPLGELGDERRGARVRALCGLGRGAQARAEAHRLLRERPDSPVAAGVADVCS